MSNVKAQVAQSVRPAGDSPQRITQVKIDLQGLDFAHDAENKHILINMPAVPMPDNVLSSEVELMADKLGWSMEDFLSAQQRVKQMLETEAVIMVLRSRIR